METCSTCGAHDVAEGHVLLTRHVGKQRFEAQAPAFVCGSCDESFVADAHMEAFELAIARALAEGPIEGASLKFMRRVLGLKGAELAVLLCVSAETVSRWETAFRPVNPNAFALVGALVRERIAGSGELLEHLKRLGKGAPSERVDLGVLG